MLILYLCIALPWAAHAEPNDRVRAGALRRAQVWIQPAVSIEQVRFDANPARPDGFAVTDDIECRFVARHLGGTTPKFDCELNSGDVIRVKYGKDNPEVYAEVAATRLLAALGFPTDDVFVVHSVHCVDCPADPFAAFECLDNGGTRASCLAPSEGSAATFTDAIVERPREGRRIVGEKIDGWQWQELAAIDAGAGGASRAQIDALRLMAVFLSHWDNKAENQRLICLDESCGRTLAMVNDLGGTFGPFKVELKGWRAVPMWADVNTCTLSMRALPYGGSSFPDVQIMEEGRAFLADRLRRISDEQIRQLFAGARFTRAPHDNPEADHVESWVDAFRQKRRAIIDRPPCPPVTPQAPASFASPLSR